MISTTKHDDRPVAMEGVGTYNRNSAVQGADLERAVQVLIGAARDVVLAPEPVPITIADYGSSQGRNSLRPMAEAIKSLRVRAGPRRPICVVHTDLADNDFSELFGTIAHDVSSYMQDDRAVYPSAVGRSFYERVLPPESVTLGWSSWAVQWLSCIPAIVPDHVQSCYSRSRTAQDAFDRQAATDWRAFLSARSFELRPGGRLIILSMARGESGDFGYRPLLDALKKELEQMVRAGTIARDEWTRMAIPTVGRDRGQWQAPFAATGRFDRLVLEDLELFNGTDQFWEQYQTTGDAGAFGAGWAAFSRASVFPTLARALGGEGSEEPRRKQFMDSLEAGVAARLASAPERLDMPLALLQIGKPQ